MVVFFLMENLLCEVAVNLFLANSCCILAMFFLTMIRFGVFFSHSVFCYIIILIMGTFVLSA